MRKSLIAVVALLIATASYADTNAGLRDVHGSKLWVEIDGSGPPLLLLHGGLQFSDNDFGEHRSFFAGFRTVIGVDRVGHGHSPDDGQPFSYQRMSDDTAALIEQLGLGPVDVVGSSDGGDIALLLARDHPTLVRRVVVTGANLRAAAPPDELERRSHWTDAQVAERVARLEAQLPPRFRQQYAAVSPDGADHWPVLLTKSWRLWMTPVVIDAAGLKKIEAPVLVVAGDHDFTSIEETTELFRGLAKGQLLIVPGAGHGTFADRAALMHLAVREFLLP